MKRIVRLTERDLTRIVRRVLKEGNGDESQYHREGDGGNPGIEYFLNNPDDTAAKRELVDQLRLDKYSNRDNPTNIGKGTRKLEIKLNGIVMSIEEFVEQIEEDYEAGYCHKILNYNYDNRMVRSTLITIVTDDRPCGGNSGEVGSKGKYPGKDSQRTY
jgi:hypothetical protein